ncbi:MAG TPA: beta-ketoacyl synthase N-terminal-like domain-containing protein [Pseudonocardiaceae bacterium]
MSTHVSGQQAAPIAIVGMAVLLPGAPDLGTYWRNVVTGVDAITDAPPNRWDPAFYQPAGAAGTAPDRVYCRRGGFVDAFADVEVTRFGIMPSSVADAEPDQLIALRVAAAAIADAGGEAGLPDRDRIGVILGRGGYLSPGLARLDRRVRAAHQLTLSLGELLPDIDPAALERVRTAFTDALGPSHPDAAIGLVPNLAASRVANRLDLRGPAYTVDAACASSLVAVDQAVAELAGGRCDLMLAGGVHHCHDITLWSVFSQLGALSAAQQIRPFDRRADGILIGEGTGVVVLKRLADAERDGDRIYAVIRGCGVASDGRSGGLANPDSQGQVLAVRQAWQRAGLDPTEPGSVGLIEAHGTATPAGDLAELATLREVFGPPSAADRPVIGTVKSMIGHTMPTAGVAGLVKMALALHNGILPPTLHCEQPHPALADTRFRPIDTSATWPDVPGQPRRAGVNAFGFGGINAHVLLEQAPGSVGSAAPAVASRPVAVLAEPERTLLLAKESLGELIEALDRPDTELRGTAVPAPPDPPRSAHRLGIVDPTTKRLAAARKVLKRGTPWRGRNDIWWCAQPLLTEPNTGIAFVFPGLEADFAPRIDDVAAHFGLSTPKLASTDLAKHGASVLRVGRLLDTALRRLGVIPDAVAGHSIGEWAAMVSAGIYQAGEVEELLASTDPGSLRLPGVEFAVLGCTAERAAEGIADRPDVVISHQNSPNQTIVCGPEDEIAELVSEFRAELVICQILPFRSGFHTPMVAPYLAPFRAAAATFAVGSPSVPVWSATTATVFPSSAEQVRDLYLRHLVEPVRFAELIEAMYQAGSRVFVPAGAGQIGALIDDTLGTAEHITVAANSTLRTGLAQLRRVATAVWVAGGTPDFAALSTGKTSVHSVRLDLSASLVRLGPAARDLLPQHGSPLPTRSELGAYGHRFPLAAELATLLAETERSALAVLARADAAVPALAVETASTHPAGPLTWNLRVSTREMPYLLDHCFAPQRAGWPDEVDRRPVVPATAVLRHIMDAAERFAPGLWGIEVVGVRLKRWLVAAPAVDVAVTVTPITADRVEVVVGDYATGEVVLAAEYPAAPEQWAPSGALEANPEITAHRFYADRWMFHGPSYQGITEVTAIGERHVTAVLTVPDAPGGLLDNVGQLFGHWTVEKQTHRRVVFPVGIGATRFYAQEPPPGTKLHCELRVRSITDAIYVFDAQLTLDGTVYADIVGWQDHRFDSHPDTDPAYRVPERRTLSVPMAGGWCLLPERWSDLASRDLYLRKYLNAVERADYQNLPPQARRHWLLGRIAVKDAVRNWLWAHGWDTVFPAEITVGNDASGRPVVSGQHGFPLPDFQVSIAHCAEAAVAQALPAALSGTGDGVGIDIEEVTEPAAGTLAVALAEPERALLTELAGNSSAASWFTRFWTAKEAAAKAEGTGFTGQPRRFTVLGVAADRLTVRGSRSHQVRYATVRNPPDLPDREYVVAWTTDISEEND